MNMAPIDWILFIAVYAIVIAAVTLTRRYMQSVADFLAAGRTAGRYILSISQGMAALGAITVVANLEMNYEAGFAMSWWGMSMGLFTTIAAVSGWVIYRFRSTRCLTLAEYFERRYSRNFRVFAGVIAFVAGLINFGIFPAVGARFFIYFIGLPDEFPVFGLVIPTYPVVMIVLLASALFSVFAGGQVAVIVTDFIQGIFTNIVFVIIPVYLLLIVGWPQITEILLNREPGRSLVNPFDTGYVEDFNFWYFLIGVIGFLYGAMSWQGTQAYNVSAKSAHEAKMGGVLSNWRGIPQGLFMSFIPILMLTVYIHPNWAHITASVNEVVSGIENESVARQMRVPILLSMLLPKGLIGALAAVMLAAFISTHNTYLHSWGSIFIQDVVLPFRKKSLSQQQHLNLLKWSILGVAVFIFFFSLLYKQTQAILLFFAITGAIFAGGSGAVIIGGLYWRRGTTPAAWAALITGSTIAVGGIILREIYSEIPIGGSEMGVGLVFIVKKILAFLLNLNGQEYWALGMGASTLLYILISLLIKPKVFNLEKLLHRGKYMIESEFKVETEKPSLGWRLFGMGREFNLHDKIIFIVTYCWTFVWVSTFIIGTVYNLTHDVPTGLWVRYWEIYIWIQIVMAVVVIIWFTTGGFKDVMTMIRKLAVMKRDETDVGQVREE